MKGFALTASAVSVLISSLAAEQVPVYYDYVENGRLQGGKVMIDSALLDGDQSFKNEGQVAVGGWPFTTILNNGPSSNRVDLVLLGDGYTAAQLGSYATHANNVRVGFFAQEPWNAYSTYFNVHRVDVTSNESGVDEIDLGIFRDTALDMAYGCFGIDRLLCINVSKANMAAASAPDVEQILALANSTRYGGAGYPSNEIGTLAGNNSAAIEIALHEFGHAFGDLADEYDYGDGATYSGPDPVEPNVSIYTAAQQTAQQLKWWRWMNLANVDAFQGAHYNEFGVYRPTFDSKMRNLNRPYEQVNVEQLVMNLYQIVTPVDDAAPLTSDPLPPCTTFSVNPLDPVDHSLAVQWSIDGVNVAGATGVMFTPDADSLSFGQHTVSVTVVDPTTRVRDELFRANFMTQILGWTIQVPGPYGDVNQSGIVDLDDILCVVMAFQNPQNCFGADISPCAGDSVISVDDILAVLRAFAGTASCPSPC